MGWYLRTSKSRKSLIVMAFGLALDFTGTIHRHRAAPR
jgi:hypothetical protein